MYFIHYLRWSSQWDRWVSEDDIFPFAEGEDIPCRIQHTNNLQEESIDMIPITNSESLNLINNENLSFPYDTSIMEEQKQSQLENNGHFKDNSNKYSNQIENIDRIAISKNDQNNVKNFSKVNQMPICINGLNGTTNGSKNEVSESSSTDESFKSLTNQMIENSIISENNDCFELSVPISLKKILVFDWEFINKDPFCLIHLPRSPNVEDILNSFFNEKVSTISPTEIPSMKEFVNALNLYFEKALPVVLLYSREREQYEATKFMFPTMKICQIYGQEHFIRLLIKIPSMIYRNSMNEFEILKFKESLNDLMLYLQTNSHDHFAADYQVESDIRLSYVHLIEKNEEHHLEALENDSTHI